MSPLLPVSVKGVVRIGGRLALLENERGEWELPGGRLEAGEQPEQTLAREIDEELNIWVAVGPPVDAHVFEPLPGRPVLILVYETRVLDAATLSVSAEHTSLGLFDPAEIEGLNMPDGYKNAIRRADAYGSRADLQGPAR